MFEEHLKRIQDKIRRGEYIMTLHAEDEMSDDGYTIYDIENGLLSGTIIERQKDAHSGEWKYLIRGNALEKGEIEMVVKFGPTDKVVIVTVYAP